jgi:hypothetical protein
MTVKLLKAKMKDGTPIDFELENLGDCIPARDADGNMYEAYTTHLVCKGRFEEYSQVDKKLVDYHPDGWTNRLREDCFHLDKLGVDILTIEDEEGPVPIIIDLTEIPPELKHLFPSSEK